VKQVEQSSKSGILASILAYHAALKNSENRKYRRELKSSKKDAIPIVRNNQDDEYERYQ
jgi:hypothetical protein